MTLRLQPGAMRLLAAYLWLAYMAWVAAFWLGLAGVGLVYSGRRVR